MSTTYVSGNWAVRAGVEDTFVSAWSAFLDWTKREAPGLGWAMLLRDEADPRHFVSMAHWEHPAQRDAWRSHPDFAAHLASCRQLCDDFRAADYTLVAAAGPDDPQPQRPLDALDHPEASNSLNKRRRPR